MSGWAGAMAAAYARGLAAGRAAKASGAKPGGDCTWQGEAFVACYCEGYGHGAGRCACPASIGGARDGRRCCNCGHRRAPNTSTTKGD